MSVLTFKEIHSGRDADDDVGQRKAAVGRYTRVFRVTTDSNDDDGAVVKASAPSLGVQHPSDPRAFLRRRRARNESFSKRVWIVTCAYSTEFEIEENPLADPADIDWVTEQFQRPFVKDRNGDAILNSAGNYYDRPVDGDDSRWTANVVKNVSAVPTWLLDYRDAVNSDAFVLDGLSVAIGEAKMQAIRISRQQERNDVPYRVLTMTIALNGDGWAKEELDQGFQEKHPERLNERRQILDDQGDPVTTPVMLDGTGQRLQDPEPDTAVYRSHDIYQEQPFSDLPLT
jgi:hypothetical protein